MTVAGFLIALGGTVLLISALSLLCGTLIETFSGNPLVRRNGDLDVQDYDSPSEVHDMPGTHPTYTLHPVADVVGGP